MMRINPIPLHNQTKIMEDYRNFNEQIQKFFSYHPFSDFHKRMKELQMRQFPREELTDLLIAMNQEWDAPQSTIHNIKRLKKDESVVVIGGQQAGLLTGPMYTINKIISILQLAKQQEMELGVPVIPVFWIAGEDHDFAEINHVYLPKERKMEKFTFTAQVTEKRSVSDMIIDQEKLEIWINKIFKQLEETEYTKDLHRQILRCLQSATSFTDFFARLIFWLFDEEGLVLIDSHDERLREIESPYFVKMIEKQPKINHSIQQTIEQLKESGYDVNLDLGENCGHLFYHGNNSRVLLIRDASGEWVGKQNEVSLSTEQLLEIAKNRPELLSNNVVTRPLMQECLFPSIAFIGGPGEVAYWAALKGAFQMMDMTMPPVVPRISFTYIDRKVEKALHRFGLDESYAIEKGVEHFRKNWLDKKADPPIAETVSHLKKIIAEGHEPLRDIAQNIRSDIYQLAEKNLLYLYREIDFLENRMVKALEEKYAKEWNHFDLIQMCLKPYGGLQERIWNPLPLLNKYGKEFIRNVNNHSLTFDHGHYLVYF